MRQETLVGLAIHFPVNAMKVLVVELILHLLEHVMIDVFTFLGGMTVIFGLEFHAVLLAVLNGNLAYAAALHIEVVAFGIRLQTSREALHEHLGLSFAHIAHHKVVAAVG